jgi:uncharacterized protein YbgA (DUF1722 family)
MTEDHHRKAWSSRGNAAVDLIEDYRQGLLPLIVPLTLLKHHLNRYPVPDWVDQQVCLNPYPRS